MSTAVPCKQCGRWPHYELTYFGKYRLRCTGCPNKASPFVSYDEAVADWEDRNRVSPDDFTPVRPDRCHWAKEVFEDGSVGWETECVNYHSECELLGIEGLRFCMFCGGEILK